MTSPADQIQPGSLAAGIVAHVEAFADASRKKHAAARMAQMRAAGAILPSERVLVLRPLPLLPERVSVSPDAMAALLLADGGSLIERQLNTDPGGASYRLRGIGLPIHKDCTMRGHSFRLETADGEPI